MSSGILKAFWHAQKSQGERVLGISYGINEPHQKLANQATLGVPREKLFLVDKLRSPSSVSNLRI